MSQMKVATLILTTLLVSSPRALAVEKPQANWGAKMQELYKVLGDILTDVSSPARYLDPKESKVLQANAGKLAKLAHEIDTGKAISPDKDPSVAIFGRLFADEAHYAERLLKQGHSAYARDILRGMSSYCIACHTRTNTGPRFESLPFDPSAKLIDPVDRGDFYAASRQFDRALAEFDKVISDPVAPVTRSIEWSKAVRYALAIAVRVKQSPELAGNIVDRIIKAEGAPLFIKQDARTWKESISAWKNEPRESSATEEGLYAIAVKLLAKAHETQKYPADRSADVLYLRASAAVHDLLQVAPKGARSGEAYLMAGLCYDVLRSFHIGELHEIYYESCIRNNPHSELARSCFQRYESSVYEGFTGSGGTHLPDELKDRMKDLEKLSNPTPVAAAAPL